MKHSWRIRLDWGKTLLAGACVVQGFQYAQAFRLVHSDVGNYALAGGAIAGGIVAGTIAYAANRLPRLRAKAAQRWGMVFFLLLMALSPFVLTPVNYYSMQAGLRTLLGWYAWILAGLVASLPEIALGLVALVDRGLISVEVKPVKAVKPITEAPKQVAQAPDKLLATTAILPATRVSKEQLLAQLQGNPGASDTAIARKLGVSRQAIASRRKQLTPQDLGLAKQEK